MKELINHYDLLIDEDNDPVHDPKPLRDYMDKWDGERFISSMELDKTKNVLEIGVGTGRLAVTVAPLCKSLCGIDISPKTVKRAAENLSSLSGVTLICDDFISHRFSKKFHVIYSSLTFMHIKDKATAIKKVANLLEDNGLFVLSSDKDRSGYIDTGTRRLEVYPDDPEVIKHCLSAAGLALIDEYDTEFAHVTVSRRVK